MEVKTVTDLSAEPVLLAVAKNHIKATYGTDATEDTLINRQIKAARILCEKYCNRSLGAKTLQIFFHGDEVIGNRVKLPYGPHGTISEVVKVNYQGTETALVLNTGYYSYGAEFKELSFLSASVNPWADGAILRDDYKVTLAAGYGTTGLEALPGIYLEAICKLVGEWYLSREDYMPVMTSEVKRLLSVVSGNIEI